MTIGSTEELAALRVACEAARARVAADPGDEAAAEALFAAVSAAARAQATQPPAPQRPIPPEVAEAARLLESGASERAEILLRAFLTRVRHQPDAMLLMANIAASCGFPENAEKILRRSVELHPDQVDNWVALARFLHDRAREADQVALVDDALASLDRALAIDPGHADALGFRAALLVQVRRLDEGQQALERLIRAFPENQPAWINHAHLLKTRGAFGPAVAAYRTAIAIDPANGTAWWLFADLKLARFFPGDIARMEAALGQPQAEMAGVDLHFALAAAYDQAKDYAAAAEQLRLGNAARLALRPHDSAAVTRGIDDAIHTFTPAFFAQRAGSGDPRPDPIFVVGMPRSGSTLVEQILASHSAIEGTAELFAVQQIEVELFRQHATQSIEQVVAVLDPADFAGLGARYLDLTRFHRRTDRPRFIDKNPGNWRQAGLIHLMLPNARIIDVRRNPLDCCFANYTQHYRVGVNYSYGFEEMAAHYADYVRLMRHFDAVMPGRVHRVIYEDLVEDIETQVRRMLDYLGLAFESACLRFYESDRAVHTPSSEQVRQPINRSGLEKWRRYAAWNQNLVRALSGVRQSWRD